MNTRTQHHTTVNLSPNSQRRDAEAQRDGEENRHSIRFVSAPPRFCVSAFKAILPKTGTKQFRSAIEARFNPSAHERRAEILTTTSKPKNKDNMHKYKAVLGLCLLAATALTTRGQIVETHSFTNLNRAIPDGSAVGLRDTRSVTSSVTQITGVRVKLKVAGEFNGDLYGYLRHGSGLSILLNRPGRSSGNSAGYDDAGFDLTFADSAANDVHAYQGSTNTGGNALLGVWQPDGRNVDPGSVLDSDARTKLLAQFVGANADGEWTLFVADLQSGGTNQLVGWELEVTGLNRPLIAWATPADIVYGTALGAAQLNATTTPAGTFAYSPPAGTVLHASNAQVLSVTFTPTDTATYLSSTTNVLINVLKAPLTIAADNKSKVYGAALPTFTATYTSFVNSDTAASLATPVSFSTSASASSDVSTYAINASGATSRDYLITFVSGTLTNTPAALTITAVSTNKIYGDAVPGLSAAYAGFVNSDTVASLDTPVSVTTTATTSSPAGLYPIAVANAADVNYTITFVNGTLTNSPAPLVVTADNKTNIFGAPLPAYTANYSGFKLSDTPASLTTPVSITSAATQSSPVGTYAIVPTAAASGNYIVSFANGAIYIIGAQSSGALASSANPALPGAMVTFTYTLSPVAPSTAIPGGTVTFKTNGVIATTTAAINGSGAASFSTAQLPHGLSTITAEYAGDGNFSGATNSLTQNINSPVIANTDTIERYPLSSVKVRKSTLLANDTDADTDTLTFVSVSATSTNSGTITVSGQWITYHPPTDYTGVDAFTYRVTDSHGSTSTGTVLVNVKADSALAAQDLAIENLGNGSFRVRGAGVPGYAYRIQYTTSLETPDWQQLGSPVNADSLGSIEITDTPGNGAPQRYYRVVWP